MKLIQSLAESQLLSSKAAYKRYTARQVAEMVYLHVIGLKILYSETVTRGYAQDYAFRSQRYVGFARWYQNGTDLHLLLHALVDEDVDLRMPDSSQAFRETLYFESDELIKWLRYLWKGREQRSQTRRLFMALDGQLQVKDSSMKAIRRLVQNWDANTLRQKQLAMTRLLQIMRVRCRRSDVLKQLELLADFMKLEIKDAANPETGDEAGEHHVETPTERKKRSLLAKLAAFSAGGIAGYMGTSALMGEDEDMSEEDAERELLGEDGAAVAAGGATTTASVAQCNTVLGAGVQRRTPPTETASPIAGVMAPPPGSEKPKKKKKSKSKSPKSK